MDNQGIIEDLVTLVTSDIIAKGMESYLHSYLGGVLISLAADIEDNGQYINRLKDKFKVDAANWVWNVDTANQKINEVITEYRIIIESNKILPQNTSFEPTIREWCDRCGFIRISYLYAKNCWDDLSDFMELLYNMKKSGHLLDSQREAFLEQLRVYGQAFNNFYNNQTQLFKKSCSFVLGRFNDEEIRDIFKLLSGDMLTAEKSTYQVAVETAVERYVSEQGAEKLKKLWKAKTESDNPRAWSKTHRTPILCMVDDKDIPVAKIAFATMSKKQPDSSSVEKAMDFLKHATFLDRLSDADAMDAAFRSTVVKSYSIILDDLDEVRSHLVSVMAVDPYDWFGLPEVDKKLREMAEYKYNQSGCDKALEKIDDMDVADVKIYLKTLIRDNMIVGMEIIKGK